MNRKIKNKLFKAFTLAEVLITLGIIGVVAALTIPVLTSNIQKLDYKSTYKKNLAIFTQAYNKMLKDCGINTYTELAGCMNPSYNNTGEMLYDFPTYFKTSAISTTGSLFNPIFNSLAVKNYTDNTGPNRSSFILQDGTLVIQTALFPSGSPHTAYFEILVDLNGYKGPNTIGKDIQGMIVTDIGIVPMGSTATDVATYTESTCAIGGGQAGYGCGIKLITDSPLPY